MGRTSRWLGVALAGAGVLWLSGCAPKIYDVKVTAIAQGPAAKGASFRLIGPAGAPVEQADLKEALAGRALRGKGLREAGDAVAPDLFVSVNCGVTAGATRLVPTSIPVYLMVPGQVRYKTQQVGTGPGGVPIMQSVRIQDPPTQRLAGSQERVFEVKASKKFLRMVAFDKIPDETASVQSAVWAVLAVFESEDSGLKNVLPVLAAASMVFVGAETKGQATLRMTDSDRDVASLRGRL